MPPTPSGPHRPWREAWQDALYGAHGFYRRPEGPAGHFLTSTHGELGSVFAQAIGALADREGVCRVLDLACGRGELLTHLHAARPDLALAGLDVVERPEGLAAPIGWLRSSGGAELPDELTDLEDVLVVAHEWLDVVPCTIAEVTDAGTVAEVLVDPSTGAESRGGPLAGEELSWVDRWWPLGDAGPGDRIEVGLARDRAWDDLLTRVRRGVVLGVDYGHLRAARPPGGTLAAYRGGQLTTPVPDGTCDLTAHVSLDSLTHDELLTQGEALRGLGVSGGRPDRAMARTDPAGYLAALSRASTAAALTDPAGLGGFWWVIARVDG